MAGNLLPGWQHGRPRLRRYALVHQSALHNMSEWAVGARGVRDIIARWIARDDGWASRSPTGGIDATPTSSAGAG